MRTYARSIPFDSTAAPQPTGGLWLDESFGSTMVRASENSKRDNGGNANGAEVI